MIRFRVNGIPAPQGSKRAIKRKDGGVNLVESSRAVGPWREAVRAEAQRAVWRMLTDGQREGRAREVTFAFLADQETGERPPVSVTVIFVLPRPAGHRATGKAARANPGLLKPAAPKYPAKRPDLDKLERAVLDGLVMGGVMADDAQVCSINSAKVYAANGEAPGALIEVEAL